MQISQYFGTPFWVEKLNFDYAAVAETCIQIKNNNLWPNRIVSNKGGWQSENLSLKYLAEKYPAFNDLQQEFIRAVGLVGQSIHPDIEVITQNANGWININELGDWNMGHHHAGSSISAVVYIQVDDNTGKITFWDDYSPMKHYPRIPFSSTRHLLRLKETITPVQGMFLAFPAWVWHEVEASNSNLTRISFASNLLLRQKPNV